MGKRKYATVMIMISFIEENTFDKFPQIYKYTLFSTWIITLLSKWVEISKPVGILSNTMDARQYIL